MAERANKQGAAQRAKSRPRRAGANKVRGVPKLVVSPAPKTPEAFDKTAIHAFHYEVADHSELPHVVKFSGGRSSGLLLFLMLENGLLNRERGDVIIFNDTSAEHPGTYEFVARCKQVAEEKYDIPFFWIQFQTYENARGGEWVRFPSYRLAKPTPWSENEPDGYHCKGEVFEELLSWSGYVPNQFQRTCTQGLKLEVTRKFLADWFACKEGIDRLGHHKNTSRMDDETIYEQHLKHGGKVPRDILLQKKSYVRRRPVFRPAQTFADFSSPAAHPFNNPHLEGKQLGDSAVWGDDGVEYAAFIGLRYDEMHRVIKVRQRNAKGPEANGYDGEHVYMPLAEVKVTREDVDDFWGAQSWNLELPGDAGLSNCVYCFMKGAGLLQQIHQQMEGNGKNPPAPDTPCDINWWRRMENEYGRDLKAEKRKIRNQDKANAVIGFFGMDSKFSYDVLDAGARGETDISGFAKTVLPCDCTD